MYNLSAHLRSADLTICPSEQKLPQVTSWSAGQTEEAWNSQSLFPFDPLFVFALVNPLFHSSLQLPLGVTTTTSLVYAWGSCSCSLNYKHRLFLPVVHLHSILLAQVLLLVFWHQISLDLEILITGPHNRVQTVIPTARRCCYGVACRSVV